MIRLLLPLAALACVGCTQERPQPAPPPASVGTCTRESLASLICKQRGDAVAAEALRLSWAKNIRWIEPGMAMTMDYREDRLNLRLDAQGRIESASCN